jgi:hypothetical protein
MLSLLRRHLPFLIGSSLLILALDVVILFYRVIGLEKGPAIYTAVVTATIVSAVAVQRFFNKKNRGEGEG